MAALAINDTPDGRRVLALSGRLDAGTISTLWEDAHRALADAPTRPVTVDAGAVDYCDGAGIALLIDLVAHPRAAPVEVTNLKPAHEVLFKQFDPERLEHDLDPEPKRAPVIEEIGREAVRVWRDIRGQVTFVGELVAALANALVNPASVRWRDVWRIKLSGSAASAMPVKFETSVNRMVSSCLTPPSSVEIELSMIPLTISFGTKRAKDQIVRWATAMTLPSS